MTSARPKIANYHFTTLAPNLGVLKVYDESIVIADIPGLIEGASEGAGLGHDFLRHIERVRLLVHIVDISGSEGRDPYDDYVKINRELDGYSAKLAGLTQIICVNKTDLLTAEELDKAVKRLQKKVGKKVIEISAYTHTGIDTLIKAIIDGLKTAEKPEDIYVDEDFEFEKSDNSSFEIEKEAVTKTSEPKAGRATGCSTTPEVRAVIFGPTAALSCTSTATTTPSGRRTRDGSATVRWFSRLPCPTGTSGTTWGAWSVRTPSTSPSRPKKPAARPCISSIDILSSSR